MKKIFLLLLLFSWKLSSGQEGFKECIRNSFLHPAPDSVVHMALFDAWRNCVEGKPMPDFAARSIDGDTIKMNELRGKIVVINFWFIGCAPCIAEIPGLNKLVKEYGKKNIVFLAITWESEKRIHNDFFPKHRLDFVIVPDAKELIDRVAGSGYPTTYIINRQGIIKTAWNGGIIDENAGEEYYKKAKPVIDELIKEK